MSASVHAADGAELERLSRTLLESAPDAMIVVGSQGRIVLANAQTEELFGYAREELVGKPLEMLIPPRFRRVHREYRRTYIANPHARRMGSGLPLHGLHRDGSEFPADISLSYVPLEDTTLVACAVRDISERKHAEDALFAEKERWRATLISLGDGVITTDPQGLIEYLNPVAEKLTGWDLAHAQGRSLSDVFHCIHEQSREPIGDPVAQCLDAGDVVRLADHTSLIRRDGLEISIQDTAAAIRDRDGNVLGVVLVFSDVTQTRQMQRQLVHQATHDALTGLVARKEFERRLKRVLSSVRDSVDEHALCYLDLDQFKVINDTCGHLAGDELLRQLGALLSKLVRARDTLARLGGDEFAILMEHCQLAQARRRANVLRRAISEYRFAWGGNTFSVGASIGLVPVNAASGTITDVLSAADRACYAAKDGGRNRIHLFHEEDAEVARRQREMQWVTRINSALDDERLHLYLQRIVPAREEKPAGNRCELLLRMQDEDGRTVLPEAFLPAAERYGLSTKVDSWVVRRAFSWLHANAARLDHLDVCEINLSGQSLGDAEFLELTLEQLQEWNVPPQKICFEVTETMAIANLDAAMRFMGTLKTLGCRFALDDFGSGVSSFGYLKTLPVDYLKIDGVFVKDVVNDHISAAMVKAINEIAHAMGKETIAEFVENRAIFDTLQVMGVDYLQGFYIGRPKPALG